MSAEENKPRVFWGYHTGDEFKGGWKGYDLVEAHLPEGTNPTDYNELMYVIEYSALASKDKELAEWKAKALNVEKHPVVSRLLEENAALKSKLEIAVKALEFYALAPRDLFNEAMLKHHENIEAGTKAREALKKVRDGE